MKRTMLFAVGASFMVAVPTFAADCVKCDIFQSCTTGVDATACECRIRSNHGNIVCREAGFCDLGCGANGVPKITVAGGQGLESTALDQISRRDPLLGTLILGSILTDSKGMSRLDTESYDGGTLRTEDGEVFHHRGSFSPRATGEIYFRFTLNNINGLEDIQYIGVILNHGKDINFTKIYTDEQGGPRRSRQNWHFESIQQ